MRTVALATATVLLSATAALAAPATVNVTISPELQAKAAKKYGVRDINELAASLKKSVVGELARSGAYADAKIDLVLADAKPNRPTFKQMGDTPGLSFESFGIGGARITGTATAANGAVTPLDYRWYETDIRWAQYNATWGDAYTTFQRFAHRLATAKGA
jgi:hypothetical protein